MTPLFTKATTLLSNTVLFLVGAAAAGLGLMVLALLALFGLAAMGLAALAAPFLRQTATGPDAEPAAPRAEPATA